MKTGFFFGIAMVSLVALSSPVLASSADLRAKIELLIRDRHPEQTGQTRETWLVLGNEAPQVIREMARETTSTAEKMRLIQALAWFNQNEDIEWIKSEARTTQKSILRQNAIRAVSAVRGSSETTFYSEFLQNPDEQTRMTAARALKKSGSAEAQSLLKKWEEVEPVDWVKVRGRGNKTHGTAGVLRPLPMRSSSELKLNKDFLGEWKGSATFKNQTLISRESVLSVGTTAAKDVAFTLKINGPENAIYEWTTHSGQGSNFLGEWNLKSTSSAGSAEIAKIARKIPGQLILVSFQGQSWVEFTSKQLPWHALWTK